MALKAPFWFIASGTNLKPLEGLGEQVSMTYKSALKDDDIELVFARPPFDASSRHEIQPGQRLTLWWGRGGLAGEPVSFMVDDPKRNYRAGTLTIKGKDVGGAMKGFKVYKIWADSLSLHDVVTLIAAKWKLVGVTIGITSISAFDHFQHDESDWAYLKRIAEHFGWRMWIQDGTLYVVPDRQDPPILRMVWGSGNILETLDISNNWGDSKKGNHGAKVVGYDPEARAIVKAIRKAGDEDKPQLAPHHLKIDNDTGAVVKVQDAVTVLTAATTQAEVDQAAVGVRQSLVDKAQKATASGVGDSIYRAGLFLSLEGVDTIHAGTWRIHEAVHKIAGDGYGCTFKWDRETIGETEAKTTAVPAAKIKPGEPVQDEKVIIDNDMVSIP